MKLLFTSPHSPEVGLLKGMLEEAGIPCEVRNENVYPNFSGAAFQPEVWILNDEDYSRASELRDAWTKSVAANPEPWTCPACGEQSEGQFGSCWNCGAGRDAAGP